MNPIDAIFVVTLVFLILLHIAIAPYTKVEESFNIQATHDLLTYSPISSLSSYDHVTFPGAVPRTFIGSLLLALVSKPVVCIFGGGQGVVRGVLGLWNAGCLLRYRSALVKAYGDGVARWWLLLVGSGFHVIYYAGRTLPNMFAFGLTTLAFSQFLPHHSPYSKAREEQRQRAGISLMVFAAVVFRSEIAVLLATQILAGLIQFRISIKDVIITGLVSGVLSIAVTSAVDSYFWQRPLWPELWGFYFNVFEGKASDWGTSPYSYYFSSLLPKLMLNPLILLFFIPLAVSLPATKGQALNLVVPSLLFVAIYSIQPHKEARFIIYVVPPLTSAAALSASYIWTRRSKTWLYTIGATLLVGSILGSLAASTGMLLISSLNYPGGEAISTLHKILNRPGNTQQGEINIHMDVMSCMTGVTHFLELPSHPQPLLQGKPTQVIYDKNEDAETINSPEFWVKFDYALMEDPAKAIGKWEIIDTIYAYSGVQFLRPGDGTSFSEHLERIYAANNLTVLHDGKREAPSGEDVKKAVSASDLEMGKGEWYLDSNEIEERRLRLRVEEMNHFGTFNLVRDSIRSVTGGWWIGPRMAPTLRILKQIRT